MSRYLSGLFNLPGPVFIIQVRQLLGRKLSTSHWESCKPPATSETLEFIKWFSMPKLKLGSEPIQQAAIYLYGQATIFSPANSILDIYKGDSSQKILS
jgi:hypothetical protein